MAGVAARLAAHSRRREPATNGEAPAVSMASGGMLAKPCAGALLDWYDRHRRTLPWRAAPGERQDPYRVFLSEIMLQQTTVVTVQPYYRNFLERWPTVEALAAAPLEKVLSAWAGLGYYARARNLHACARAICERHGGRFPEDEEALLALPGIGPYTAAAIASIAFERRAAPVDGNWERVVSRLFAVDAPLPKSRPALRALALTLLPEAGKGARYGDFAQAMMDLGASLCTPRKPACALCPWRGSCVAQANGNPEAYPVKLAKAVRPTRYGIAFLVQRENGAVLARTRPAKGLLGGMSEVPSTPWEGELPAAATTLAPLLARWQVMNTRVSHVFSHFALELTVWRARVPDETPAPSGCRWVPRDELNKEAFPSVMAKVLKYMD